MKNEFDYFNDMQADLSEYRPLVLTESEREKMKNTVKPTKKFKITAAAAVCAAAALMLLQTAFAQNFIDGIIKTISTGYNSFSQYELPADAEAEIPDELKGLYFDADGKPMTTYKKGDVVYSKDGEVIIDKDGNMTDKFITEHYRITGGEHYRITGGKHYDDPFDDTEGKLVTADFNEAEKYLEFDAKLPQALPEGYSFYCAEMYRNDDGSVSGLYLNLYYKNQTTGKCFVIHERLLNEETAFSSGTDGTIEEITVNGKTAVLTNGRSLDWEDDGVSVGIAGRGYLSREELIKTAESVK